MSWAKNVILDCFHCGFHFRVICMIWKASNITLCRDGLFKVTSMFKGWGIFIAMDQKWGHMLQLPRSRETENPLFLFSHIILYSTETCILLFLKYVVINMLMEWQAKQQSLIKYPFSRNTNFSYSLRLVFTLNLSGNAVK